MSNVNSDHIVADGGELASTRTRGASRLVPAAATFALGAALLAGVVVAPDAAVPGLGGAVQELIGMPDTGCCGNTK
ncbi:hypothetical protein AB0C02_24290 [Micromonospora sp. NPDC048999]|uniref:hypothetical protein n=1 Tax=Micromonospora sp. NPDC048999 TaxID=3155391 RepID=UPI00340A60B9